MAEDQQEPPSGADRPTDKKRAAWFERNRSGPGWHPGSWQGWLILGGIVAAIVAVVVLFRTGLL
jgi:hypothetical protein